MERGAQPVQHWLMQPDSHHGCLEEANSRIRPLDSGRKKVVMDQNCASWNQLVSWLGQLDALIKAA